jgi:hypothetical protein
MQTKQLLKGLMGMILLLGVTACNKDLHNVATPKVNLSGKKLGNNLSNTSAYWNDAQLVHGFITQNLLVTSTNCYRANTTSNSTSTWEWYNVSQIYADAAFYKAGDTRYLSYLNNTYAFMSHMWDSSSSVGGYWSATDLNGNNNSGVKYIDDNALTGVAYLDAYEATNNSSYLTSAEACANYLMNCGLWDSTFGGGFWQSTQKLSKPTQSNGLAMQLFAGCIAKPSKAIT